MARKKKTRRALTQDDIYQAKFVVSGRLSPTGDVAVYQVSESEGEGAEEKQTSSLWLVSLETGDTRRLTSSAGNDALPVFAPDGKSVYFLSTRDKVGQVYRIRVDGGEAEAVTTLPQGVGMFDLSPDGKWLAFSALAAPPQPPGPNDHVRLTREWYRFDPIPGYLHNVAQAVYVMRSAGGKPKALTPHDGVVAGLGWSPDSKEVAFAVTGQAKHRDFTKADLEVVTRRGERRTVVGDRMIVLFFWTPDGQRIGYSSFPGGDLSCQPQLFIVDSAGGRPRSRTAKLDLPVPGIMQVNSPGGMAAARAIVSDDGSSVLVSGASGGEARVYDIKLKGRESCEAVIGGERICTLFDRVGDRVLFAAQDCNTPPELYLADLTSGEERALTTHNADWQAEIRWPSVERVVVKSARGVEIEGWVLKPRHVRAPYKTVLYIHGGPHGGFGYGFCNDFQELVGAGYALAFCNPRGSTGYGDVFAQAIIGCWGKPEQQDFDAFLDELVDRGIAKANRLAVTGVSGGGHLSGWLIGHTDRFKAAVPEQGVYSMISMWATSDAGRVLMELEMGGAPHEIPEVYWELSPVAYAHKCKTPTLLIQGENDIRCPMEQAEQMYSTLKHNGCEVELLRLKNCNHGLELMGPPPLRRSRMDAMIDWFDRYV